MSDSGSMEKLVSITVSCVPGLEFITASECSETFGVKAVKSKRGRVSFKIPLSLITKLQSLRSVHHYWLVISEFSTTWSQFHTKETALEMLEKCVNSFSWKEALFAFNYYINNEDISKGNMTGYVKDASHPEKDTTCSDDNDQNSPSLKRRKLDFYYAQPSDIKFRVTCSRNGKHEFTSMEAAKYIGSGVKEKFNWQVNLTNYDIEILLFIDEEDVALAIQLSTESKHNRNITCFGPTTLRATTAFCLLKLAGVKKGDIVCDPMCGGGSICLEGAISFPFTFQIGGENHPEGCVNARKNFENMEEKYRRAQVEKNYSFPHSILQWDAQRLPLRDGLVDIIVCDMPFGKRIGYKGRNFQLYPAVLKEMGRVCKPNGKAVLLTQHKSAMNKALNFFSHVWKKQASFFINMGGLNVGIYVLKRILEANTQLHEEVNGITTEQ